jgi:hypothetical protein
MMHTRMSSSSVLTRLNHVVHFADLLVKFHAKVLQCFPARSLYASHLARPRAAPTVAAGAFCRWPAYHPLHALRPPLPAALVPGTIFAPLRENRGDDGD